MDKHKSSPCRRPLARRAATVSTRAHAYVAGVRVRLLLMRGGLQSLRHACNHIINATFFRPRESRGRIRRLCVVCLPSICCTSWQNPSESFTARSIKPRQAARWLATRSRVGRTFPLQKRVLIRHDWGSQCSQRRELEKTYSEILGFVASQSQKGK